MLSLAMDVPGDASKIGVDTRGLNNLDSCSHTPASNKEVFPLTVLYISLPSNYLTKRFNDLQLKPKKPP